VGNKDVVHRLSRAFKREDGFKRPEKSVLSTFKGITFKRSPITNRGGKMNNAIAEGIYKSGSRQRVK